MAVIVTVHQEGEERRTLRFERSVITLGRDPGNSIALDDRALSRTHCQFEVVDGGVFVRDLNSRNGTWLKGVSVTRARLQRGDAIRLGKTEVVFEGTEGRSERTGPGWKTLRMLFRPPKKGAAARTLEEENRRLRQLLAVTRNLVSELDQDALLSSLIDTAVDLTSAERGFLLVFRGVDVSVEVARNYWRKDVEDPEIEISHHIAAQVRRERKTLIIEDAAEDERFEEFLSVHALKLRSVLCVPLIFRGDVVGVLYLDNRFNARDVHGRRP